MEYDLEYLSRTHGFNVREMEKVCRISDVLAEVMNVKFLRERLSLYGGSALNFIYLEDIPRLSVDLDFNYRHIDAKDWGEVRDEVEERLKQVLSMWGYTDVHINPKYPLCRIDVSYNNSLGTRDSFQIEVGYMRRHPILKSDKTAVFMHVGKEEGFGVLTPRAEELFANKFATCLYRASSRDIYDLYRIEDMNFDAEIFRKCTVVDCLMRGRPALTEINVSDAIDRVSLDTSLRNLLRIEEIRGLDFQSIKYQVIKFCEDVIGNLTEDETALIGIFYSAGDFRPGTIDEKDIFHPNLREHPAIQWSLKKSEETQN